MFRILGIQRDQITVLMIRLPWTEARSHMRGGRGNGKQNITCVPEGYLLQLSFVGGNIRVSPGTAPEGVSLEPFTKLPFLEKTSSSILSSYRT